MDIKPLNLPLKLSVVEIVTSNSEKETNLN